jgi:hypothetical protein
MFILIDACPGLKFGAAAPLNIDTVVRRAVYGLLARTIRPQTGRRPSGPDAMAHYTGDGKTRTTHV